MARVPMRKIDWANLEQVKAYAREMGPGMSVIKRPERPNFNITHTSRKDLLVGAEILFQT